MNATVIVVTRLTKTTIRSTYINMEGEDDPWIVSLTQHGPPFRVVGRVTIPDVGQTSTVLTRGKRVRNYVLNMNDQHKKGRKI